jgi:integrase
MRNGKVSVNPARLVRPRREPRGRHRFLSREEYATLRGKIAELFPEHFAEFVVSVHTGMRLSEQYSITWSQFHPDRKTIELDKTKNGDARTVHLNKVALEAIESVRPAKPKPAERVFHVKAARADLTPVHGSSRAWRMPRSRATRGTPTAMGSALGLLWPESRSRKFRSQPGTRPSPCQPVTLIFRLLTGSPWSERIASTPPVEANSHQNSHQESEG